MGVALEILNLVEDGHGLGELMDDGIRLLAVGAAADYGLHTGEVDSSAPIGRLRALVQILPSSAEIQGGERAHRVTKILLRFIL